MNAFIAAVIEKKTILIANEGQAFEKKFSGICHFNYGISS